MVLSSFNDPSGKELQVLKNLTPRQWQKLLHWLDTSGLALYFLDRLSELNAIEILPLAIHSRLEKNLADNTQRMEQIITEFLAIQKSLLSADISFAILKGFSLWPHSVPRLELRSQLDLDFLIKQDHATQAREILEARGYSLHAISGDTWEFKADPGRIKSIKDLYKPGLSRTIELHIEPRTANSAEYNSRLSQLRKVMFRGYPMPVLSPIDLFIGQGLHLYKHICSEFSRTAHVVEFRRHIVERYHDHEFWRALQANLEFRPGIRLRVALVIYLISRVTGSFAPQILTAWIAEGLPADAILWVDRYGARAVLASFPGSKLYLLLQQSMEVCGVISDRSIQRSLLPRSLPQRIDSAAENENIFARVKRHQRQLSYTFLRARFHAVEALRYFCESYRWRHSRNGLVL